MAPIHDTDLADQRWSQAEWENYELWEKQELRIKRKKRLWILTTTFVFLVLSAVPIIIDQWPKWMTRSISRHIAQEINRLKRDAIINRTSYRLRFTEEVGLGYKVERLDSCMASSGETIKSDYFVKESIREKYLWISPEQAEKLSIPGLVGEVCYDFLLGSEAVLKKDVVIGIGIIPAKDLTEKRVDRVSVLLLSGPSAEISFD
jgi:hypothetical protein